MLVGLGAFGALGACATLDAIETNVCGNHVAEAGEDCDGTPADGTLCGERDSVNACRFVWVSEGDCPEGYVESKDHRCRKPTGEFVETTTFPLAGEHPQAALIDGDDVPDVGVAVGSGGGLRDRFVIHSIAGGADSVIADLPALGGAAFGAYTDPAEAALAVGVPNALEFVSDGDGSSAGVRGGLTLLRSTAGALDLKVFTNTVVADDVRFVVLPKWIRPTAVGPAASWDLSLLGMITWNGQDVPEMCVLDTGCTQDIPLDGLNIGPTVQTDFDDGGFLLSAAGDNAVFYVPRAGFQSIALFERLELPLEGGATLVGTASLGDLNGDGLTDIVALGQAPDTGALGIYCLFGFPPDVPWSQGLVLRQVFNGLEDGPEAFSHGLADHLQVVRLNRDAAADLLVGGRFLVSKRDSFSTFDPLADFRDQYREDGESWDASLVATGDLNGDGLDDMVGQPFGSTLRYVFGGETLPLVRADANIKGQLIEAAISDFNGDGAGDVLAAFGPDELGMGTKPAEGSTKTCNVEHDLVVAFGRSGSFPTVPASVGTVPQVLDIVSSRFVLGLDGFGDFGLVTSCQSPLGGTTLKVATVLGNAYDLVNSPFLLARGTASGGAAGLVPIAVFGADVINAVGGESQDDLVIFGSTEVFAGTVEAYVWPTVGDAELDNATAHALALPSWWAENYWIFPYDSAVDVAGAPGIVAAVTTGPTYSEEDGNYATRGEVTLHLVNSSDQDDQTVEELPSIGLPFPSNPNFWTRTYASIVVTHLNDDDVPDFVVVYGTRSSEDFAVTAGGAPSPAADPTGAAPDAIDTSLLGAMGGAITLESEGDTWVSREVSGFAPEAGHSPLDAVVVDGRVVILTTWGPYALSSEAEARSALPKQSSFTSFVGMEAVSADFDDDGLKDILVVDGDSAALWSQLPANP